MPQAGFYNQNLYRDYPFQTQGAPLEQLRSDSSASSVSGVSYALAALPHELIVDFGVIMGVFGNYSDRTDWVYLYRVTRDDPFLIFEFRTTANGQVLRFTRRTDDSEYKYEWAEAQWRDADFELPPVASLSSASAPSESEWWLGCEDSEPVWEGFLVTGKFDDILDMIPNGAALYFDIGHQVVEPSRIQNLKESYIRSIGLANRARTHVIDPEQCTGQSEAQDTRVYEVVACLQGALAFEEGYNCQIRQENAGNTIVIGAGVGLGAGEVCEEYPFYPGESIGAGETYYTGGPTCGEILRTLNGKGGSRIRFEAGTGFNVRTDVADPSTIIVDMTLEDFAICLNPTGTSAGGS